jgi:hypothetical protein
MPRIKYKDYKPNHASQAIISLANEILEDYDSQGFDLTLRQLYYQFIRRDYFPNSDKSYDRLVSIISRAREAGMVDWDYITDRGRLIAARPHWEGAKDFMESVASQYSHDLWLGQDVRVEVWIEKDALSQIAIKAARPFDVAVLANKGYVSASAAWQAGNQRFLHSDCARWVILHLGDHDPSGIDMTRDLQERLKLFSSQHNDRCEYTEVQVRRIALNMDQIHESGAPPNPAKHTDARYETYRQQHGDECWELDAMEPATMVELIQNNIKWLITDKLHFEQRQSEETLIRHRLAEIEV